MHPSHWTGDQDIQWNGIIQLLLGGRSLRLPLQQGKSWPLFLGCRKGDFGRYYATWSIINTDLYIQTLKNLQKLLRRVRPQKKFAKILLQLDNVRPHTQVWKHTAQILLRQNSTSLETTKMLSVGKGLGVKTRLLKKWLRVQDSDWYSTRRRDMILFLAGARLLKLAEIM
jgi:hypothetical protein